MAEHQLREEALIAIGKDFNSAADLGSSDAAMWCTQATKILRADDCSLFLMDDERRNAGTGRQLWPAARPGRTARRWPMRRGEGLDRLGGAAWRSDSRRRSAHRSALERLVHGSARRRNRRGDGRAGWTQRSKPGVLRVVRIAKARSIFCRRSSRRPTKMCWSHWPANSRSPLTARA